MHIWQTLVSGYFGDKLIYYSRMAKKLLKVEGIKKPLISPLVFKLHQGIWITYFFQLTSVYQSYAI